MRSKTDICIVGGGPAGSVLAIRLAQLGHGVSLIERAVFPRRHLGESLSPGVLPLLAMLGLDTAIASAGFTPVYSVTVDWDQGRQQREDSSSQGLLVDRGLFDRLLLNRARAVGVYVFQPARIAGKTRCMDGWKLAIQTDGKVLELRAAFLADATGRAGLLRSRRRETGCRTVALHGYWQGRKLPIQPRIKAGDAEWYWGVPLPNGVYNTLVFMDAGRFRAARASWLSAGFRTLIEGSGLLTGCADARLLGRVSVADATPYLDEECLTRSSIKVGDAALALDPLSSSGVQKAIQTALSGAVVVNTLLRKPELADAAVHFYHDRLREASERHCRWASGQYAAMAAHRPESFWSDRAAAAAQPAPASANSSATIEGPLDLCRKLAFVNLPCLEGAFVQVKAAVQHPALAGPVAYLGDWELAPLLRQVRAGMTLHQLSLAWAPAVPLADGRAIAHWLIGHGLLVPAERRLGEDGPMIWSIADWLKTNDVEAYLPVFVENQVDLKTLEVLTDSDLKELGLPFGPRKRLLSAMAEAKLQTAFLRAKTEAAAAAAVCERRQLTVMFCDLVESTALSTRLDPEELRGLIQTYRKACSDVVARYDGHVALYLGDGLMIYFGWPMAHEDDPERGVRAALEMVQAVKAIRAAKPLAVRIGLATGQVVVGENTQDTKAEAGLAVGDTPNLAARVQAAAGVDEVVIAPNTRLLVRNAFALTELGPQTLKGIAQPVQLWRVEAVRRAEGRFKVAHAGLELALLVGREEEGTLLESRWQQARDGNGQAILIGGQPGIGKSRLLQDLRDGIAEPHHTLHFQCSPYHLNSPLHPFIEQFELAAGIDPRDPPEQRLEKMEAALASDAAARAETVPLFAALLSIPAKRYPPLQISPRKQKELTLDALIGRVVALSNDSPVLMLVEDLHWSDPTSQELLELLVPKLPGLPILLVLTHRPEYVPWWAGRPGVTSITLNRLGHHEGARLINSVAKGKLLPPEVLDEILTRTDGVPLYVEELTKSVLESGLLREEGDHYALQGPLAALAIPTSLRDSLMARLDRLGAIKELAQIGACIGREFSHELIARISMMTDEALASSLEKLVEAGLVSRQEAPPAAIYTFKHALVQDAAYDSLLKTRRSELHACIADLLETDFVDRASSTPEWLAHHHTQAGHLAQAIPLWRNAGTLAVGRVALKEAVAHFQKGLLLIDQLPPSGERDRLELTIREPLNAAWTGLRGWAAPEVGVNAAAALRLAENQSNAQSRLLAIWWIWTNTITQGRIQDSLVWVERLLARGAETDDLDLRIFGHATAAVQHFLGGQLLESRAQADRAIALYDPQRAEQWIRLTGHDLRTFVEVYVCQLLWMLGYPEQARRLSDEVTTHAQADGHAFNLVWALTFSAYVFAYRREPERFLGRVDEANRLACEQGLTFIHEVAVPQARGLAELQKGRPREAISLLRQGIERWTRTGGHVRVPLVKSALAEAVALEGDPEAALEIIAECLEQIERPAGQERLWLAEVLRLKGWILLRQGREDEAERQLLSALECARRQQAKSWELRCATTLARHWASRGRLEAARELLAPIYGWFTEGADTQDLMAAKALLEELAG